MHHDLNQDGTPLTKAIQSNNIFDAVDCGARSRGRSREQLASMLPADQCPLSGVKRTSGRDVAVSAVDPKLTRALRDLRAGRAFCLGSRGLNLLFAHRRR